MINPVEYHPRYRLLPFLSVALLFILVAPLYWHRVELGEAAQGDPGANLDLYLISYPYFAHGFGRLDSGAIPLWNPEQNSGVPFLADPRSGVFAPANAVFLRLPTHQALAVHAFVCLSLMGAGFTLFARSLGVRHVAAAAGAAVYAFSGLSAAAMSRPPLANALAVLPLVFWAIHESGARPGRGPALVGGVAAAAVVFSGANALVFAFACLAAAYAAAWTAQPGGPGLARRISAFGLMTITATAVSAVQWLPTLHWLLNSSDAWPAFWNFNPALQQTGSGRGLLAQALQDQSATLPRPGYIGILTLLFVPASLTFTRARRHTFFFLCGLATCLALTWWFRTVPFGFPRTAFLYPALFCIAGLTAIGADRILSPRQPHRYLGTAAAAALVLSTAAVLLYVSTPLARGFAVSFVLLTLPCLLLPYRWIGMAAGALLVVGLCADFSLNLSNRYSHPYQDAPACYRVHDALIRDAAAMSREGRSAVAAAEPQLALLPNLGLVSPLALAGSGAIPGVSGSETWWAALQGATGESGPQSARVEHDAAAPHLLSAMAVNTLLVAADSPLYDGAWANGGPPLRLAGESGPVRLFVNDAAVARAYWTPRWTPVDGVEEAADRLGTGVFPLKQETLVDAVSAARFGLEPLDDGDATTAGAEGTSVAITEDLPERVTLSVDVPQPGIAVLADSYAPGWAAYVDGRRAPLLRVNGLFRGVPVEAGASEVTFVYRPWPYLAGLVISLASLIALVGGGLFVCFR